MSKLNIERIKFACFSDFRGMLTSIESNGLIPFEIKRLFYMHNVPGNLARGGHAHRYTNQVLIACHGSVDVRCSDGISEFRITLCDPNEGILVPKMIWTDLENFKDDAVCLVLADTCYEISHSIRAWEEFIALKNPIPAR